jgi:hypothetical protein
MRAREIRAWRRIHYRDRRAAGDTPGEARRNVDALYPSPPRRAER